MSYTNILNQIIQAENTAGVCTITGDYKVVDASYDGAYTYFTGVKFEGNPPNASNLATQQLQTEVDECVSFAKIADKVPYLGQFICDFSFFDKAHSGLMNDEAYDGICRILDNMRINNTILKIHTPGFYNLLYTIVKKHAEMETLAEQYQAEWRVIADKYATALAADEEAKAQDKTANAVATLNLTSNIQATVEIENKLLSLFTPEYFNLFKFAYGKQYVSTKLPKDVTLQYYDFNAKTDASPLVNFTVKKIYPEWQT